MHRQYRHSKTVPEALLITFFTLLTSLPTGHARAQTTSYEDPQQIPPEYRVATEAIDDGEFAKGWGALRAAYRKLEKPSSLRDDLVVTMLCNAALWAYQAAPSDPWSAGRLRRTLSLVDEISGRDNLTSSSREALRKVSETLASHELLNSDNPEPQKNSEAARLLYKSGRFSDAADQFDALWAEYSDPAMLWNAAVSRDAAEQTSHAAERLDALRQHDSATSELRDKALARLKLIRQNLTAVRINVRGGAPTECGALELKNTPTDTPPPINVCFPTAPAEKTSAAPRSRTIYLEQGEWTLRLVKIERSLVVVGEEPISIAVSLPSPYRRPKPLTVKKKTDESPEPRKRLALAMSLTGGVIATASWSAVSVYQMRLSDYVGPDSDEEPTTLVSDRCVFGTPESEDYVGFQRCMTVRTMTSRSVATGFTSAGVSLLVPGLSNLAKRRRPRQILHYTELGAGTLAIATGLVLSSMSMSSLDELIIDVETPWSIEYQQQLLAAGRLYSASAAFLGAGSGLVTGSAISLAVDAAGTRRRARAHNVKGGLAVNRNGAMLSLQGKF